MSDELRAPVSSVLKLVLLRLSKPEPIEREEWERLAEVLKAQAEVIREAQS